MLDENNGYFLVLVEKNDKKYIVCKSIDEMGTMLNQEFFSSMKEARQRFNELINTPKKVLK